MKRDLSFSIAKCLAIVMMVLGHSACPSWLTAFVSMFHMPFFFLCSGYFFKMTAWDDALPFLSRRFRGLYVPFVKWSVAMLCLHNVLSLCGIINGPASALFSWQEFFQRVWSCVFNLSGYDAQTCGAYWFFRALLLVNLFFWGVGLVLRKRVRSLLVLSLIAAGLALIAALWQTGWGLRMTGVAQGGYRELMGLFFFSMGAAYHQVEARLRLSWPWALGALVLLLGFQWAGWRSSMTYVSTLPRCLSLAVTGLAGFVMLRYVSVQLARLPHWATAPLAYVGERTLYVFAFHAVAFKVVSMIKVGVYGLPWRRVGDTMVVQHRTDDAFFLLYTLAGVALPLLVREAWLHYDHRSAVSVFRLAVQRLRRTVRDIVEASDTKDE